MIPNARCRMDPSGWGVRREARSRVTVSYRSRAMVTAGPAGYSPGRCALRTHHRCPLLEAALPARLPHRAALHARWRSLLAGHPLPPGKLVGLDVLEKSDRTILLRQAERH